MRWHYSSTRQKMIHSFGFWLLLFGIKCFLENKTEKTWANLYMFAKKKNQRWLQIHLHGDYRGSPWQGQKCFFVWQTGKDYKGQDSQAEGPKKSESTYGVTVCKENGNGRETVHGKESGQDAGGKQIWPSSVFAQGQSCYLNCYIHT